MFYASGTAYGHSPRAGPFRVTDLRHDGEDAGRALSGLLDDLLASSVIVDLTGKVNYPTVAVFQIVLSSGLTCLDTITTEPPRIDDVPLPLFENKVKGQHNERTRQGRKASPQKGRQANRQRKTEGGNLHDGDSRQSDHG